MVDVETLKFIIEKKGKLNLKVSGRSMIPLLKENDEILLSPLKNLKRFDLIAFSSKGQIVCHYFWGENNKDLLTRPLNPIGSFDFPIETEQIIGKVENVRISIFLKFKIFMRDLFV
jgi:phage repressor protein C with HTH and peptisase S24 domain